MCAFNRDKKRSWSTANQDASIQHEPLFERTIPQRHHDSSLRESNLLALTFRRDIGLDEAGLVPESAVPVDHDGDVEILPPACKFTSCDESPAVEQPPFNLASSLQRQSWGFRVVDSITFDLIRPCFRFLQYVLDRIDFQPNSDLSKRCICGGMLWDSERDLNNPLDIVLKEFKVVDALIASCNPSMLRCYLCHKITIPGSRCRFVTGRMGLPY